ncbi:hypothetical protein [Halomonas denitrificans]|nr:hypothetical protein [Halomonas denitrificans]
MKTIVVSLIFLPIAAVVLLVPLVRLAAPVWPVAVEERLDPVGRPELAFAGPDEDDPTVRSRPLSAAVLDRGRNPPVLGYVVAVREPDGVTREPPASALWWPGVERPGCDLGLSVERVLTWRPCSEFLRVHHPNRMTTISRLSVALDRLLVSRDAAVEGPDDVAPAGAGGDRGGADRNQDDRHETDTPPG